MPRRSGSKLKQHKTLTISLTVVFLAAALIIAGLYATHALDIWVVPTASITSFTPAGSASAPTKIDTSHDIILTCAAIADKYNDLLSFKIKITDTATNTVILDQRVTPTEESNKVAFDASYTLSGAVIGNSIHVYKVQWTVTENGPVTATGYMSTGGSNVQTGIVHFSSTFHGVDCQATLTVPSSSDIADDINGQTTPCTITLPAGTYTVNATTQQWNASISRTDTYVSQLTFTVSASGSINEWFEYGWNDVSPAPQQQQNNTGYGTLAVTATLDGNALSSVPFTIQMVASPGGAPFLTPYSQSLPVGTYSVTATYNQNSLVETAVVSDGQTFTLNFAFTSGSVNPTNSTDTVVNLKVIDQSFLGNYTDTSFSGTITANGQTYPVSASNSSIDLGSFTGSISISTSSTMMFSAQGTVTVASGSNNVTVIQQSPLFLLIIIGAVLFVVILVVVIAVLMRRARSAARR